MAYKVFISHSTSDIGLVTTLAHSLQKLEIEVFVADWYLSPGESLEKKIVDQIKSSNCVIVLLTRNGIRSNWVHQEIGCSLQSGLPIIPLVEHGIGSGELAALQGREHIEFNPYQPQLSLDKLSRYVKELKLKKEEQEKAMLVAGGILLFLLLAEGKK